MSRASTPPVRSQKQADAYPRAKGVALPTPLSIPRKVIRIPAAWLIAACLGSVILLSFLVVWTLRGNPTDAAPSDVSVALTPKPVVDLLIPSSPATPAAPVARGDEPALSKEESPPSSPAVEVPAKETAKETVPAAATPETPTTEPAPLVKEAPPLLPVEAPAVAEKPVDAIVALPEKPLAAPPLVEKRPDPGVVDCSKLGTNIVFLRDPPEAFKKAREERKLVFFIHLSGNFEDDAFT